MDKTKKSKRTKKSRRTKNKYRKQKKIYSKKKIKYTKRDNNRKHKTKKKLKGGASEEKVGQLTEMGFDRQKAMRALETESGDLNLAIDLLSSLDSNRDEFSPFEVVRLSSNESPIVDSPVKENLSNLSSLFNKRVGNRGELGPTSSSLSPMSSPFSPTLSLQSSTSSESDFYDVLQNESFFETPPESHIYLGSTFIKQNESTENEFLDRLKEIELTIQGINFSPNDKLIYQTQGDLSLPEYTVVAFFDNLGTTPRGADDLRLVPETEPEPEPELEPESESVAFLPSQMYNFGATVIGGFYWGASSILNMLMMEENIRVRYGVILTDDSGKKYVAEVVEAGEEEGEKYYEPVLVGETPKRIFDYSELLSRFNFIVISFMDYDGHEGAKMPVKTIEPDYDESRYFFKLGKNPGLIIGEVGFDSFSEDLLKVKKEKEIYKISFEAHGDLEDYLHIEWESFKKFIEALNSLPPEEKRGCDEFINAAHQGLSGVIQGVTDMGRSAAAVARDTAKTAINAVTGEDDVESGVKPLKDINCGENNDYSFRTRRAEQIVCVILRLIKCGFLPQIIGFFTPTSEPHEDSRELSTTTGRETVVSTNMFQNTLSLALNIGKDTLLSGINILKNWFQTLLIGLLRYLGIKSFEKLILELQKEILADRMGKFQRVESMGARLKKYTKHIGFEAAKQILKENGREGASRVVGAAQAANTLKEHYDENTINRILTELSSGGIEMAEVLYHIFIILYGACATDTDKKTLPSLNDITKFFSSPLSAMGKMTTLIQNMFSSMYNFLRSRNLPSKQDYVAMRVVEENTITQNFESELGELKEQLRELEEQLRESRSLEHAYLSKEIEALGEKIREREGEKDKYNQIFEEEYHQLEDAKTFDEAFSKRIKASSEARDLWNMLCNALSGCTVDSYSLLINTEKMQVAARHLLGASREYNSMSIKERKKFISFLNLAQGIEGDPHGAIASMFQPKPELTSGALPQLTQGD